MTDNLTSPPLQPRTAQSILSDRANRVLGRRWLATLIDFVVCISILLIPDALLGNAVYQQTLGVWIVLLIAYFPLMEGFTGYSVGKFITRVRVVDNDGNLPGLKKATIRTLFRLMEVNPILLGGVPAGLTANFSKYEQRVGDMVAGTYVLSSSAAATLKA
ncbi:MAG: RDD family protein [Pseudomonadota bacterium]